MLETNGKMEYLADFYTCKPITGQSFADRWTPLISATGSGFSRACGAGKSLLPGAAESAGHV